VPQAPVAAGDAHSREIEFFLRLVRQENRRNSVRDLFRGTTELLARRVTEQASRSGEHYITESRGEFFAMYRAAAGAGLIIAAMALVKILTAKLDLPPVWEAVAFSLNHGVGFVLIHVLHLTIATKQPAMTAGRFLGWDPVGPDKAAHLLHDLHPWRSLALLHAAIAGVYLFLSGLISGYYDNQSLYHRVPERLRRVKSLRRLLGEERLARLSDYVERNLGALAGNFPFGCMLGCTPIAGELLGLPLDIRHVAFSSANFAYGLNALEFAVPVSTVVVSFAGVLLIGLVNLVVSFALALKVALRSRGITPEQTRGLWARVLRRFLSRPRDFFWPPAAVSTV